MSERRRTELSEEAFATLERLDLVVDERRHRTFVESAKYPRDWDRSWDFFAYSYCRAFDQLWDAAYARNSTGVLDYPVLFIARHSIELWLKAAIWSVTESVPPKGHGLDALWTDLIDALSNHISGPLDDMYSSAVRDVIRILDSHDGKGDRFRYPTAGNSKTYPSSSVDLEELYRAHYLITSFCDAVDTQMTVEREHEHFEHF